MDGNLVVRRIAQEHRAQHQFAACTVFDDFEQHILPAHLTPPLPAQPGYRRICAWE